MKKLIILACTTSILFVFTASSFAGECVVHYKRTACAGQEKISYRKCGGHQECDKTKKASTMEECQTAARHSCANARFSITKLKVITATYDGHAIKSAEGEDDFCLHYAKKDSEFNQCS